MSAMPMEARLAHLEGTVGQIGDRLNGFDARFTNLERKIDILDERLSGRMDALDERLSGRMNALDERLSGRMDALDERLGGRIDALISHMDAGFQATDRRFTWLMGLVVVSMLLPVIEHFTLR